MSTLRLGIEGGMVEVTSYEPNPEYLEDLRANPVGEDEDPGDTLDEFIVTIKVTVKDPLDLASLRLMAEHKQRINITSS